MFGVRLARASIAVFGSALLLAPAAHAALPSVASGERPGPPLLYASEPASPQLSVQAPFSASPLLVSGTDAYRDGEYVYQDYLFDDRGADTVPLLGSRPENLASQNFSPTAGDVQYPSGARYAGNAADLVEFRIKPTAHAIVYRVTLNSVVQPDTTVVGIGIDTDLSGGGEIEWPKGAGVSSPGLDRFITAWGTGGELTSLPGGSSQSLPGGAVSIDTTSKQMTISVPRSLLDPGSSTWRYVTGTGLWNAAAGSWRAPANGTAPSEDVPASGNPLLGAPAVFNLGFRFDEPQIKQPGPTPPLPYSTAPGTGNWYEDKQALLLGALGGTSTAAGVAGGEDLSADVDFAKLAAGSDEPIHAPGATQARIFASSLDQEQGVRPGFPEYRGQLQPYTLRVPPGLDTSHPTGLTFALHSLGGGYTQFSVFSPNQQLELGDQRDNLVATPLGHGPDGWYRDEGELDVFEVWADVNRHFDLDPDRAYVSGYSMGGYGSYKLGVEYPDLWARAFTTVGPPAEGVWIPPAPPGGGLAGAGGGPETLTHDLLQNLRWVPYLNWVGSTDQLVPVIGPNTQQQRFDQLGLRSSLLIFAPADHFTLAILDQWDTARDFLGDAEVKRDPSRVDYSFFPAADRPDLGLVHNHAYWVYGLDARDTSAGPGAVASISARSLAHGEGDPTTAPVAGAGADAGPPLAYTKTGTEWTGIPEVPAENALEATLENLGSGHIDGARALLDGSRQLRVELDSDGATELRLDLALPAGTTAVRVDGGAEQPAPEVGVGTSGASFSLDGAGSRTYLLRPGQANAPAVTPAQGNPSCKGRPATIVGTSGSDRGTNALRGTSGVDVIAGLGGRDRIAGRGGADIICGNRGRDSLRGGRGKDACYGGPGRDSISTSCERARSPRR